MLVKIPEFNATGSPQDLLDWYKSLGWNPGVQQIDCRKIGINRLDDEPIINKFLLAFPEKDRTSASMFWLNYGPSPRGNEVPIGHILLEEGWVTDD